MSDVRGYRSGIMASNNVVRFVILVISLLAGGDTIAASRCSSFNLPVLRQSACSPSGLTSTPNSTVATRYSDTLCVSFHLSKNEQGIGLMCSSTSQDFLTDFGVVMDEMVPGSAKIKPAAREVGIATGMSLYSMERLSVPSVPYPLYGAEVDCDEESGPVYRATSTCYATISFLPGGYFLYGSFVLKNHVAGKTKTTKREIIDLWRSLRFRQ